jgi:hypothetical protein
VVNHAQDLHQSVIGVQLMFLARENKSLLFWLSVLGKKSAMKIDYLYFYSLFLFCFIPVTVHQQQKLSMKSNLTCKKGRYQQIIKTAQLYLFIFFILVQIKVIWKYATFYKTHNTKLLLFKFFPTTRLIGPPCIFDFGHFFLPTRYSNFMLIREFRVGFPTGRDSATFRDKGTEVS